MFWVVPHVLKDTGDAAVVKFPAPLVDVYATVTGAIVFDANAPVQVTTALPVPPSVTVTFPMEKTAVDAVIAFVSVPVVVPNA